MFHLFGGPCYDPRGGMGDYLGCYPSLEAAQSALPPSDAGWGRIAVGSDDGALRVVSVGRAWREPGLGNPRALMPVIYWTACP